MKIYKCTYLRVADNEAWSGWKITGKSSDLPIDAQESFFKYQSNNSNPLAVNNLYDAAPIVWELICDGKYIFYSKLTYGFMDMARKPRETMRADSYIVSLIENPNLSDDIATLFTNTDDGFVNRTKIETIYPNKVANNEPTDVLPESDIVTAFESVLLTSDEIDYNAMLLKYFNNKNILTDLIKCIYWVLTDSSAITLNLIYKGSNDDKKNIIYLLINSLPICMRSQISFRTLSIPEAMPTKLVFLETVDSKERYFDISTGANNIITEFKLASRLEKYDFITYPLNIGNKADINEYFSKLDKCMSEFGVSGSLDLNLIKIAHEIVLDEMKEEHTEITNSELLKKLQTFLMLPLNNEKIDWYISKFLETILERKIELNESQQERLQAKLKVTNSEVLQNIGYSFNAIMMIKSNNRKKEFAYLYSLLNNAELFNCMINKILAENGGAQFVDEFYGDYYGDIAVKESKQLDKFFVDTRRFPIHARIDDFVARKCEEFGRTLIQKYYRHEVKLSVEIPRYTNYLVQRLPQRNLLVNEIFNKTKLYFWDMFDICKFEYKEKDNYLAVPYRTNHKCAIVNELIAQFDNLKYQKESTINNIVKIVTRKENNLNVSERKHIFSEVQKECLNQVSKNKNLDFWFSAAVLIESEAVTFIVDNDITVFTDVDLLNLNLYKSRLLSEEKNVDVLLRLLDLYMEQNNDVSLASAISKELRSFVKESKKREKSQKREQEKALKKSDSYSYVSKGNAEKSGKTRTRESDNSIKNKSAANYKKAESKSKENIDFVTVPKHLDKKDNGSFMSKVWPFKKKK